MSSPSMVHRSGDTLVVRSVVSGDALYQDGVEAPDVVSILDDDQNDVEADADADAVEDVDEDDLDLPQCKIKRNYTCPHCDYYSQNPRSYLYHLKDVHKQKIRVYECPSCLYASKHSQKLQRHVHMVHVMNKRGKQKVKKKTPPKKIAPLLTIPGNSVMMNIPTVDLTPHRFPTSPPATLMAEMKPASDGAAASAGMGELLNCSVCGFTTRNTNAMARHEKLVHLKKRFFRCTKCNYVTHMRARYTKHVKYHSMPMIKCDLCDFRTPYKWNLDRHYKNHQGDGAYKCSLCNFTADIKQSLTVHEMNHHVPPVGQVAGAAVGRRRNKVGASDTMQGLEPEIDQEELELLRMERENDEETDNNGFSQVPVFVSTMTSTSSNISPKTSRPPASRRPPASKAPAIKRAKTTASQPAAQRGGFQANFIHPDDIVSHKNGNIYIKTIKCRVCSYKAAWEGDMARHELKSHGIQRPIVTKKIPRPIPNLIPIQNKTSSPPPTQSSLPILRIPSVRARSTPSKPAPVQTEVTPDPALSDKDLNDICAKSCPNSSLRDFASLMGGDAFNMSDSIKTEPKSDDEATSSPDSKAASSSTSTTFKKKNASFFDKLKEKLMVGSGETCNLTCWCGHESKCLSELMRHQKLHNECRDSPSKAQKGTMLPSGAELSSTRCQHCRQRCKTSSDLVNHLQSCMEANKTLNSKDESVEDVTEEKDPLDVEVEEDKGPHPMENKVFVWNNMPQPQEAECEEECLQQMPPESQANEEDSLDESVRSKSPPTSEGSLVGIETAPGYGAVTSNVGADELGDLQDGKPVKKVFKCPHCTFWASTASRFHVHIVGHLNKKPFECSLCSYRSNWRWDITKHIRLKSARDANHEQAGVLMTDETGRRNYSKYNKYLTLMRVHESTAESSGSGRRSKGGTENAAASTVKQLPSPPQLTRAPSPKSTGVRPPLRPPPPLRVAHHVLFPGPPPLQSKPIKGAKRPSRAVFEQGGPPAKRPSVEGKKTLWKCKKCNFRDARRELVLAHVKEHYQQRELQQTAEGNTGEASVGRDHAPFRCGHCHQVSNWKHVIQRHCRLKHSGDVKVVRGGGSSAVIEESNVEETCEQDSTDPNGPKHCEICPFTSVSSNEMAIHKEHHSSWPGATYKCHFCLYFVSLKKDLLSHLRLHGVTDPEDFFSKAMLGKSPLNQAQESEAEETDQPQPNGNDANPTKRYKCINCPYVSNSKSQFLYHKQFHRPRGAPFKCGLCSYNVSRRHLLHQHLRVHGIVVPPQKTSPRFLGGSSLAEEGSDEIEEVSIPTTQPLEQRQMQDLDTCHMAEIPLVWVSRGAKFFKMYKCRFCPHVNVRKANIVEHEKMHSVRTKSEAQQIQEIKKEPGTVPQQHHCPDCNYVCNNAGVLSSHAKVHQGMYGLVHCLVDSSRSDESQLQELHTAENIETDYQSHTEELTPEVDKSEDTADKSESPGPDYLIESKPPLAIADLGLDEKETRMLYFCSNCPARFLFEKELSIHIRFHEIRLLHRCESCSYTARQRPHLLAHFKVHSDEYQERTTEMLDMYQVCSQHPRPRTAVIVEGPGVHGPVWVVIGGGPQQVTPSEETAPIPKGPNKQFACSRCPANFFKSMALQYHMTLHGGTGLHKCRFCDYAVKTYGNLVKHEMIHNNTQGRSVGKSRPMLAVPAVPLSGTDLFQHRAEAQKDGFVPRNNYLLNSYNNSPSQLHIDPQFGILMHGNPEYVYPTYFKNGRLKEKRYKCHKCPSAFEKREQYKVHLSLHGSKQRYKCEKCDYSVKYYANYIQHMRKHQINDEAMISRQSEQAQRDTEAAENPVNTPAESNFEERPQQVAQTPRSAKTICMPAPHNGPLHLSVADRQSLMLLQLKRATSVSNMSEPEDTRKTFTCPHCPYSSQRRDGVESHVKRHEAVSGLRGAFVCDHCDYSVPQQHFLREHNKLHFTVAKKQPEAFMKCSRMELWIEKQGKENITEDAELDADVVPEKMVVFKDHGSIKSNIDRFYPTVLPGEPEVGDKVYVNLLTGDPLGEEVLQDVLAVCQEQNGIDDSKDPVPDLVKSEDVSLEDGAMSCDGSDCELDADLEIGECKSERSPSLSSASLNEEIKGDVISDSETNDSENNVALDSTEVKTEDLEVE